MLSPTNPAIISGNRREPRLHPVLAAAIAIATVALLQLELVFAKSINWDELYHWSFVNAAHRGESVQFFQRPYVTLFSWIPGIFENPLDEIRLARLLLWPLGFVTAFLIYDIARGFGPRSHAFLCALAYFTGGYVFLHSFAVRADPVAAMLLTISAWAILARPPKAQWLALAGLCFLIAFIATIKSLLWAPSLTMLAAWRWREVLRANAAGSSVGLAAVSLMIAALFAVLVARPDFQSLALDAFDRMFQLGLSPNAVFILLQIGHAPVLFALLCASIVSLARHRSDRLPLTPAVAMLAPLIFCVIYRNAFPYFYTFILPLPSIALMGGMALATRRYPVKEIGAALLASAAVLWATEERDVSATQREVLTGVMQIFPDPVTYIDDSGIVPHFKRAVPKFGSGWALATYRENGMPIYRQALEEQVVPLLIRKGYALEMLAPHPHDSNALMKEDTQALRENFIPHWGFVYVAGKVIKGTGDVQLERFLVPGTYTVDGGSVAIDGAHYQTGKFVTLTRGVHRVAVASGQTVTLRWGRNLARPAKTFPTRNFYTLY